MNDYPQNWPDIARKIKDQADWRCEHCHHPHDPDTGYCLTVHHLDMDKLNCDYGNLVALCQRCHLRIQAQYQPKQLVFQFAITDWMRKRNLGALK